MRQITSYAEQLKECAEQAGVNLKRAFLRAGVADSTYYRSVTGDRSMRLSVAEQVRRAIEQLAEEQRRV